MNGEYWREYWGVELREWWWRNFLLVGLGLMSVGFVAILAVLAVAL